MHETKNDTTNSVSRLRWGDPQLCFRLEGGGYRARPSVSWGYGLAPPYDTTLSGESFQFTVEYGRWHSGDAECYREVGSARTWGRWDWLGFTSGLSYYKAARQGFVGRQSNMFYGPVADLERHHGFQTLVREVSQNAYDERKGGESKPEA